MGCIAEPPSDSTSMSNKMPVLGGLALGVTATCNRTIWPTTTTLGTATPTPVGEVCPRHGIALTTAKAPKQAMHNLTKAEIKRSES